MRDRTIIYDFPLSNWEKMASSFIEISTVILVSFSIVAVNGTTENLQATNVSQNVLKLSLKNNEDHVWNISPVAGASSSHFLEIYWYFFSVRGTMPMCENDYVEVKLTR